MFKRGNLTAKYRAYVKSVKSCKSTFLVKNNQNDLEQKCLFTLKGAKYGKLQTLHTESLKRCMSVIASMRDTATEKSKPLKEKSRSIQANLQTISTEILERISTRHRGKLGISAAAIGLFKQDPVTVAGYNSKDSDFLRQLGITNNASGDKVAGQIERKVVETTENPVEKDTVDCSLDFSSYDNNSYSSIFDNMPPESYRNDLYTSLSNMFSTTNTRVENRQSSDNEFLESQLHPPNSSNDSISEVDNLDLKVTSSEPMNGVSVEEFEDQSQTVFLTENIDSPETSRMTELMPQHELLNQPIIKITDTSDTVIIETNPLLTNASGASMGETVDLQTGTNVISPKIDTVIVEPIPEPPVVPDIADAVASNINSLGEATFASLGLGGWTPVGIVQNCFEFLHVSYGLPWWECIAIGTVIIRFLLFPLVIISQRNAARMNNHLPQLQVIQLKMTEARQTGNQLEAARYSQELMSFMKDKNVNPLKNMIVPLAQMPVFLSFFVGLRQMANVPVESLRTGGMLWFTDLTVPDQFFLLPVITSITLFATIELGTDSAKLSAQNMQTMKYVLRALPLIILPFTVNFPGVILCYWATSNLVSLGQVGFLKIPAVRRYFNIDALIAHNPANLPVKSKGFIGGIKESWTNLKITRELEDRRRLDEMQFQRAGKGPLVKTYKYDPTKPTMSAKGR